MAFTLPGSQFTFTHPGIGRVTATIPLSAGSMAL
jgi:hypothetical protein